MSWLDDLFSNDEYIPEQSNADYSGYEEYIPEQANADYSLDDVANWLSSNNSGSSGDAPLGGLDMSVPGNYEQLIARLALNPESGSEGSDTISSLLGMLGKFVTGSNGAKSPLASLLGLGSMAGQVGSALTAKGSPALKAPAMTQANPKATPMTWKNMRTGGTPPCGGSQGALGLLKGASGGQLDNVPIAASHGEYVFDADSVSALGDGNTDAGAAKLDKMRENLRRHKRSAPASKIPPKSKSPEQYLKGAK